MASWLLLLISIGSTCDSDHMPSEAARSRPKSQAEASAGLPLLAAQVTHQRMAQQVAWCNEETRRARRESNG